MPTRTQFLDTAARRQDDLIPESRYNHVVRAEGNGELPGAVVLSMRTPDARCCCEFPWTARRFRMPGPLAAKTCGPRRQPWLRGGDYLKTTACVETAHTVTGTNANGRFGQTMTHLMSRATIDAADWPNTDKQGSLMDPNWTDQTGSLMPAMAINEGRYGCARAAISRRLK